MAVTAGPLGTEEIVYMAREDGAHVGNIDRQPSGSQDDQRSEATIRPTYLQQNHTRPRRRWPQWNARRTALHGMYP
jgi:hypothetical protein